MQSAHVRATLGASFLALAALGWAGAPETSTTRPQDVEVVAHAAAGRVHWLEGQGGNIGVFVGDDEVLMIDDQFENLAPKIRAAVAGLSDKPLRYLVNTHFHGDHTGSNKVFGAEALVLAHENVRVRLMTPDARSGRSQPAHALPVVTFEHGVRLHLSGEDIEVRHVPAAHTDGDSVIHFPQSNVWHLGDLFFSGRFPYIDIDSGGSVDGLIDALDALLPEIAKDAKIIPGHGPLSTRADLETYVAMLKDCRAKVAAAEEAGSSVAEMLADRVLADYEGWAWNFISAERFLEILSR